MANPAPLQTYFNPLPEAFVRDFFDDLQRNVSEDLVSVTSITISRDGTLVYYDQGENGFDDDIANPTNIYSVDNLGGTQIWGDGDVTNGAAPGIAGDVLNAGDVIILNNVINALLPQNNPADAFDGGDKFASTAAVSATRLIWPQGVQTSPTGSFIGSTVLAGAVEVVDTFEYGTAFTAVIGENSDARGTTSIFEEVRAFITAAEDGTEVFLNGTSQGTINQGQTLVIADVNEADRITTTDGKAVEAHLLTGDDDGNFETRWYSLTPDADLGNDYFSPVTTKTEDFNNEFGERTLEIEYFIHNPGTSSITVNWQGSDNTGGSFTVAPGTTETINTAALPLTGSGTVALPEDSAIRFFTEDPADKFAVVSALDVPTESSGGRDYDWGFTLQDVNSLSTGFVTGFAFGSANPDGTLASENGSPIWVTAVADTTVTVDWDGNLNTTADQQQVQVNALESVQLFDSDNDQSGARVFTTDGTLITGAYGEDALASNVGDPFIDFGYTIRSLPALSIEKATNGEDADVPTGPILNVGETATFTYEVTNTGGLEIANVQVTDDGGPDPSFNPDPVLSNGFNVGDTDADNLLDPGEVWQYIGTRTVTAGQYTNIATVTGDDLNGNPVAPDADPSNHFGLNPDLEIIKTATNITNPDGSDGGTTVDEAGDVINYTITVENTGNVDLTNVTVSDPLLQTLTGPAGDTDGDGELDVDETWTYTGSYTVIQENIDSNGIDANGNADNDGDIDNIATVTTDQTPPEDDDEDVPVDPQPELTFDKVVTGVDSAGDGILNAAGDIIDYDLVVTNTGNQTLTNVTVTDPLTLTNTNIGDLAPGVSQTISTSYTITQADIDSNGTLEPDNVLAGQIDNTAIADSDQTDPISDDEDVPLTVTPELVFDKVVTGVDTAGDGILNAAGDIIDYDLVVTNEGNVTLTNVTVTDPLTGTNTNIGDLAPNATATISTSYTITQDDIDSNATLEPDDLLPGQIDNTATADSDQTDPISDDEDVPIVYNPDLDITKTATSITNPDGSDGGTTVDEAGDVINYTIAVENTGNVDLTNVTVTDPLLETLTGPAGDTDGDGELDVDETWTYTGSYTVIQDNIDSNGIDANGNADNDGDIDNIATVTTDQTPPEDDDEDVPVDPQSGLLFDKVVTGIDTAGDGILNAAGDIIDYDLVVTNTGSVTLTNVTVTDPLTLTNTNIGDLAPGVSQTVSTSYTITQEDIDSNATLEPNDLLPGQIDNTAIADSDQTPPQEDDEDVPVEVNPELTLDKVVTGVDTAGDGILNQAGDIIDYDLVVTNTGNQTLTNVTVTDPLTQVNANIGDLVPNATATISTSYTITQADIDSNATLEPDDLLPGQLDNTATADSDQTDPVSDDEDVPLDNPPELTFDKVVTGIDTDGDGILNAAGDIIDYDLVVTNTGSVTLTNVTVTDPLTATNTNIGDLAPGESQTVSTSYAITQADIDSDGTLEPDNVLAGQIDNTATADSDQTDPEEDSEDVPLIVDPDITITKTADVSSVDEAGDVINYTITVENTGNTSLTNVIVDDPLLGGDLGTPDSGDDGDNILEVGETWVYNESYTVTQADIDSNGIDTNGNPDGDGDIDNTVTVTTDQTPPKEDDEDVPILTPGIDIEKFTNGIDADTLAEAALVAAGETVTWTYEVTNTGEVPFNVDEIEVTDDQGVIPVLDTSTDVGGDNILSPGETWIYSASEAAQDLNVVMDFEQFVAGDQGNTINAGLSGVSISTDWRHGIMIFDSANPTGDPDDDLGTPHNNFGGPGNGFGGRVGQPGENSIPQGQVLILSQDGDPTDPNDAREGGTITFDWDTPVRVNQIGVLDVDTYEDGSTVTTYDAAGDVIDSYELQTLGDNSFQIVSMDDIDVSRMEVFFSGSSAITEIDFDNAYQNIGTVSVAGLSDNDPSSYFNTFEGPKDPAPQGDTSTPPTVEPGGSIRYEAENLNLNGYLVEQADFASNGQLVALSGTQGSVSTTFEGNAGQYNLEVAAFDEKDGNSPIEVLVNGQIVGTWTLDQNLDGTRPSTDNLVVQTFTVDLEAGDIIEIKGTRDDGERARLDYFKLQPTDEPSTDNSAIRFIEAENLVLNNYEIESEDFASGGQLIALAGEEGSASTTFEDVAGNYTLTVNAFDEADGESTLKVLVNDVEMGQAVLDQNLDGTRASANNLVSKTFELTLEPGDEIKLEADHDQGERARIDSIAVTPDSVNLVNNTPTDQLLSGGTGADLFNITKPSGDDIVENFVQGVDRLWFNIDGIDNFSDLDITPSGSNTLIGFSGISNSSVTLTDINPLTPDDVLFGNSII